MAARAVRLIQREAFGRLAGCVDRLRLAMSGEGHNDSSSYCGEEVFLRHEYFQWAFYRNSCNVEPDVRYYGRLALEPPHYALA